jgi:hypothetical protein
MPLASDSQPSGSGSVCSLPTSPTDLNEFGGRDDPLQTVVRAEQARHTYLYDAKDTVFDRFHDIPPPGGLRLLNRLSMCYEVLDAYTNTPLAHNIA